MRNVCLVLMAQGLIILGIVEMHRYMERYDPVFPDVRWEFSTKQVTKAVNEKLRSEMR